MVRKEGTAPNPALAEGNGQSRGGQGRVRGSQVLLLQCSIERVH